MADRPILFSGPMVRAIIERRKTQTRRVLKPQPEYRGGYGGEHDPEEWGWADEDGDHISVLDIAPNGYNKGDRLYVREAWMCASGPVGGEAPSLQNSAIHYMADGDPVPGLRLPFRPSIHMPRWASRLTLIVTDVRVQRLQEISEGDAMAEGVTPDPCANEMAWQHYVPHAIAFKRLWDSLAKPGATWADNPWIAAITFDTHHCNIDAMEGRNG